MTADRNDSLMPTEGENRRDFLKKASRRGLSFGAMTFDSLEEKSTAQYYGKSVWSGGMGHRVSLHKTSPIFFVE